ncbi:MAG: TraR/DksA C4-type zinc finger protein [Acidimicrobiales bacterium]
MAENNDRSTPDYFPESEVELIDEIVLSEDILDEAGEVIGEHIETIDLLEVDGQGVVVIDDVTIVNDDEGDMMIDEIVAVLTEDGDVLVDEILTIADAEGDVMVEEHLILADAQGDVVVIDSVTISDGTEPDDRLRAAIFREELDGVELALDRLDAGTYGMCETCGNPIDDALLAEIPQARSCSAHLV